MRYLLQGSVFVVIWFGCVAIGWLIPYYADPRHDVEFAIAATLGVISGAIVGLILGYWTAMAVFRPAWR